KGEDWNSGIENGRGEEDRFFRYIRNTKVTKQILFNCHIPSRNTIPPRHHHHHHHHHHHSRFLLLTTSIQPRPYTLLHPFQLVRARTSRLTFAGHISDICLLPFFLHRSHPPTRPVFPVETVGSKPSE